MMTLLMLLSQEPSIAISKGSHATSLGLSFSLMIHLVLGVWAIQNAQTQDIARVSSGTVMNIKLLNLNLPVAAPDAAFPPSPVTPPPNKTRDNDVKVPILARLNEHSLSSKEQPLLPTSKLPQTPSLNPKEPVTKKIKDKQKVNNEEKAVIPPATKKIASAIVIPQSEIKNESTENPIGTPSPIESFTQETSSARPSESYENRPLFDPARLVEKSYPPNYPDRSIELNQEGTVLIRVLLTEDGESIEFRLWRSSGFVLLDNAALSAIRKWRFKPAEIDGQKVAAWVQIPVNFKLN